MIHMTMLKSKITYPGASLNTEKYCRGFFQNQYSMFIMIKTIISPAR